MVLEIPLVQHFLDKNHKFNEFHCVALEKVTANNHIHRDLYKCLLQRETFWVSKLNTMMPNGLNQEVDYGIFL